MMEVVTRGAEKKADKVLSTWIGGSCVMVSEGHIYID